MAQSTETKSAKNNNLSFAFALLSGGLLFILINSYYFQPSHIEVDYSQTNQLAKILNTSLSEQSRLLSILSKATERNSARLNNLSAQVTNEKIANEAKDIEFFGRRESVLNKRLWLLKEKCNELGLTVKDKSNRNAQAQALLWNYHYKLVYCPVAKGGSSLWKRMFSLLESKFHYGSIYTWHKFSNAELMLYWQKLFCVNAGYVKQLISKLEEKMCKKPCQFCVSKVCVLCKQDSMLYCHLRLLSNGRKILKQFLQLHGKKTATLNLQQVTIKP